MRQLILGGARSGKSQLAEQRAQLWAEGCDGELFYLATGVAGDEEMAQRIAHHQSRRDARWQLIEEPAELARVILRLQNRRACLLVDCLTLWLSHCLHTECWDEQRTRLLDAVAQLKKSDSPLSLIMVSNEVGSGVVPLGALSRKFVDASGWLHQALARECEIVTLVVAGLPLELKTS